jgi:hypothetical protein
VALPPTALVAGAPNPMATRGGGGRGVLVCKYLFCKHVFLAKSIGGKGLLAMVYIFAKTFKYGIFLKFIL